MAVSAQTSAKLSSAAKSRPRDANGHFVKAGTDPTSTTKTTITSNTPIETIQNPPSLPPLSTTAPKLPSETSTNKSSNTKTTSKDLDAPLVVINNPFRKLLHWLDDIRKKQTTTFDLKISVPLIALPIFLVVVGGALQYAFHLGQQNEKAQISPTPLISPTVPSKPILISKVGIIKGTYNVLGDEVTPTDVPTTTPIPPTLTPVPTNTPSPTFTPTPTPLPPSRFVLVDKDEKIFFLITPNSINLYKYINQRVLITGMYDSVKETIEIKKLSDIEVLP